MRTKFYICVFILTISSWDALWFLNIIAGSLARTCVHRHFFGGVRVAHLSRFFVLSYYVSLHSEFRFVMSGTISAWNDVRFRLYLQLLIAGLTSYLRFSCLFADSGVQHILCCVFVLFFFVLCALCCQCLWIVHCWLPLRWSLKFIWQLRHLHYLKHVLLNIGIRIIFDLAC